MGVRVCGSESVLVRLAIFINFPRVITITIRLHLAPTQAHIRTQANKSVLALFMHITHLHEQGWAEWEREKSRVQERDVKLNALYFNLIFVVASPWCCGCSCCCRLFVCSLRAINWTCSRLWLLTAERGRRQGAHGSGDEGGLVLRLSRWTLKPHSMQPNSRSLPVTPFGI